MTADSIAKIVIKYISGALKFLPKNILSATLTNSAVWHHRIETIQTPDFLVFPFSFGITVILHQNADTMIPPLVLASALMRGIHPLIIFKMADIQGGCLP